MFAKAQKQVLDGSSRGQVRSEGGSRCSHTLDGAPGALWTLGARCPHPEVPFPVESPHVAAAAADPAVPRAQPPAQGRQQLCGDLPALVVNVPHHQVPAACNNTNTTNRAAEPHRVTLRAPGLGVDVKLCLWKHPERGVSSHSSTLSSAGTWGWCWHGNDDLVLGKMLGFDKLVLQRKAGGLTKTPACIVLQILKTCRHFGTEQN